MVTWIGFMSTCELQTEMLPNLGQFFLRGRNIQAEIVDPKDADLFSGERWRCMVGGGRKMMAQKRRSGKNLKGFAARERHDPEFRELGFDGKGCAPIFVEQRLRGRPLCSGFLKDAACVFASMARGFAFEKIMHLAHEAFAVRQGLGQRPIKPEPLTHQKFEVRAAYAIAASVSRRFARDGTRVVSKGPGGGVQETLGVRGGARVLEQIGPNLIEKSHGTFAGAPRQICPQGTGFFTQAAPLAR